MGLSAVNCLLYPLLEPIHSVIETSSTREPYILIFLHIIPPQQMSQAKLLSSNRKPLNLPQMNTLNHA